MSVRLAPRWALPSVGEGSVRAWVVGAPVRAGAAEVGARIVERRGPSLDEIFVAQVGRKCAASDEE